MKDGSADKNIAIHAEGWVATTQEVEIISIRPKFDLTITG
jgi:hypothetical protein